MSTKLHDVPNNAALSAAVTPRTLTTSFTGPAIDLIAADGRCFAVQSVGTVGGTSPTLAGKFQESASGASWADISGAIFTTVAASDDLQMIAFDRAQRYVRYIGTVTGTSPTIPVAVFVGQQKKQT